jgi:chorismate lyase / 3-hydroxybenzoate synthase
MTSSAARISISSTTNDRDLSVPAWVIRRLDGATTVRPAQIDRLGVECCYNDSLALVTVRCREAGELPPEEFRQQVVAAYDAIARKLAALPAPHPVRFWNHIPSIHAPCEEGIDRYMVFNAGRHEALSRWFGGEKQFARRMPTASGIGHHGSDLVIHCLSATKTGHAVANPRQVAPYHYSQRFGPLPPCFARATILPNQDGESLILVGGTASIRGEDSVFIDDLPRQSQETMANLAALIRAALGENVVDMPDPAPWLRRMRDVRIYFPRETHRPQIAALARSAFPAAENVELIGADLCRRELLIEIEGLAV